PRAAEDVNLSSSPRGVGRFQQLTRLGPLGHMISGMATDPNRPVRGSTLFSTPTRQIDDVRPVLGGEPDRPEFVGVMPQQGFPNHRTDRAPFVFADPRLQDSTGLGDVPDLLSPPLIPVVAAGRLVDDQQYASGLDPRQVVPE